MTEPLELERSRSGKGRPDAGIKVRPLEEKDRSAWDRLVESSPRGTLFHLLAWRDAVRDVFPFVPRYLVAEDGGREIVGAFPLFEVRNPLVRPFVLSIPFAVYGGIVARDSSVELALLAEAERLARSVGAKFLEIRSREETGYGLPEKDLYVTFVRDLPDAPEACLALLPRKARAAARHAADRFGLSGRFERESLPDFYRLFVANKRDLGSPALPARFLRSLLDRFGERAEILSIRKDGQAIAGVMTFFFRDMIVPYYSGGLAAFEKLHPNNYMYLRLMQLGVERGFRRFDFGRSRRDTGAFDFKKNQGFEPTPLHYQYRMLDGSAPPDVNPGNPRFDLATRLWKRLPLPVARVLGPVVSRYFP